MGQQPKTKTDGEELGNQISIKANLRKNNKDMKPFHIDPELEGPILLRDVLQEVPAFRDFWYQRGITKFGDHEF